MKNWQREIDFNFFQHEPYLKEWNNANGYNLVNAGDIHVEPITAYSDKYITIEEIPDNAVVAIPNDGTNEYTVLYAYLKKVDLLSLMKKQQLHLVLLFWISKSIYVP